MDIKNEMLEWEEGVFFNSGMFAGQLGKIFLDNAPAEQLSASNRDAMAPAQFAAGWFDGISHEDKRDDLYKCYSKNDDLTNALYDAMEAYIAGDS